MHTLYKPGQYNIQFSIYSNRTHSHGSITWLLCTAISCYWHSCELPVFYCQYSFLLPFCAIMLQYILQVHTKSNQFLDSSLIIIFSIGNRVTNKLVKLKVYQLQFITKFKCRQYNTCHTV